MFRNQIDLEEGTLPLRNDEYNHYQLDSANTNNKDENKDEDEIIESRLV